MGLGPVRSRRRRVPKLRDVVARSVYRTAKRRARLERVAESAWVAVACGAIAALVYAMTWVYCR